MSSNITKVIAIRVLNEVADWMKGKDSRLLLESTVEQIKAGKIGYGDNGVYVSTNVVSSGVIGDIEKVIELTGEDADEFFRVLYEKLNEYEIVYEDGEIRFCDTK